MLPKTGRNGLSGNFPSELAKITSLQALRFPSNLFSGTIPSEYGDMRLQTFDVNSNAIVGTIPSNFFDSRGVSMGYFNVSNNFLRGPLPFSDDVQFYAPGLTSLDFSGNMITGTIPSEFVSALPSLSKFHLDRNFLTGSIPTELAVITSCRELSLGGNKITGSIPSEIGLMTYLDELDLSRLALTGPIPEEFYIGLTNLRIWRLESNLLTGSISATMGNMSGLEGVYFQNNQLSGQIPTELSNLSKLRTLALSGNNLDGVMPLEICDGLPELEFLSADCLDELECVCCHVCY